MGRRGKDLSMSVKTSIVSLTESGLKQSEICKILDLSKGTISVIFSRLFCAQSQQPTAASKQKATVTEEKKDPSLKYVQQFNPQLVKQLSEQVENDMPLHRMPDPFEKNFRKCLLCEKDIDLDWKNVRLLSQFVSPFTGRIYGRHITQLCIPMQKRVAKLIKRARVLGYMAYMNKDPHYLNDPRLFDPLRRHNK